LNVLLARPPHDPRVRAFLFSDGGIRMPAVVVGGKNQGLVRQGEQLPGNGVVLLAGVTAGEIAPAGAVDEESISGENAVVGVQANAVGCVTRGREDSESN